MIRVLLWLERSERLGRGVTERAAHALLAALLLVLLVAPPARGQALGVGELTAPGVSRDHVERAFYVFETSAEQEELIDAAYEDYLAQVRAIGDRMREVQDAAFAEYRDTGDPQTWRDLIPVIDRFESRRADIDGMFLADMRLVLSPEQDARWPVFERDRRRMTVLREGGLVSGDTVDMVDLVETMPLSAEAREAAAPIVERYASEMDRVVREVAEVRDTLDEMALEAFSELDLSSGEPDLSGLQRLFDLAREQAVKIRDINRSYAELLGRSVPGEEGDAIERAYFAEAYPRVYRTSTAERTMEAALSLDDLSDEQQERVAGLRDRYLREAASINGNWVDEIDEAEGGSRIEDLFAGQGFGSDAERALRRERRDLDLRYADSVRALLTAEQAERLPEPARLRTFEETREQRRGGER